MKKFSVIFLALMLMLSCGMQVFADGLLPVSSIEEIRDHYDGAPISYEDIKDFSPEEIGMLYEIGLDKYFTFSAIVGDADMNGRVTVSDARTVLRYALKLERYTAMEYYLSDVDGDGDVDISDARSLLRYASNTVAQLPLYD